MIRLKSVKMLEEVLNKIVYLESEDQKFHRSLKENSLYFLFEQEEEAAVKDVKSGEIIKDVNKAADMAREEIDSFLGTLPSGKFPSMRAALGKAKGQIGKARLGDTLNLKALFGDKGIAEIIRLISTYQGMMGAISNAVSTAFGALKDLGAAMGDEDKDELLGDLIDKYTAGEAAVPGLPSRKDFEKAIAKDLKTPKSAFGDLATKMKGIAGFFKGGKKDIGFDMTQDQFVEDILSMTATEFNTFVKSGQEEMEDSVEASSDDPLQQIAGELEQSGVDMEQATSGEGPPPGAVAGEGEGEGEGAAGYTITRKDLKAIKDAMGRAKEKKKSQTKALGGELNSMLGKAAFMENRWYSFGEAELLIERLLVDQVNNTQPYRAQWTTEELAQARLLRMAGLRDD